jgi:hypothetical protein
MTVTGSQLSDNTASIDGGAIFNNLGTLNVGTERSSATVPTTSQAGSTTWEATPGCLELEPGFEIGKASFVSLDQIADSGLGRGRNELPEFVRDWWVRIHAAGLAINPPLGHLDP